MTQIDFYTNVADRMSTACRIVAKGYALRHRIVVLCPDADTAQRVDRLLWTTPATGFIPHCAPAHPLAALTPVIIDPDGGEPRHDQLLVNLRPEWPAYFGRFERLIEIVGSDDDDRRQARERYRFYRDRGYEIRTHDLHETTVGA
jgi:DNA polymerase-3 subunit chi